MLILRKLRQVDHKFKASLGYIARPCLKKKEKEKRKKKPRKNKQHLHHIVKKY
jgi:hypothetical protein